MISLLGLLRNSQTRKIKICCFLEFEFRCNKREQNSCLGLFSDIGSLFELLRRKKPSMRGLQTSAERKIDAVLSDL